MKNGFLALCLAAIPALAANVTPDAPMAQFRGKDQAMFEAALYGVLDNAPDGTAKKWANPETRAGGEVKAVKSFERDGKPCRTVAVANKAGGRTSSAKYDFCRSTAGKWMLAQ